MTSYCVHASADEIARPHRVEAEDFVDAALAYAERWLAPDPQAPVVLYVQDEGSGEERCLTLDLDHGEARPCA
jgi:hypothetical protein